MIFKYGESFNLKARQKTSSRSDFVFTAIIFYPFRSISEIKTGKLYSSRNLKSPRILWIRFLLKTFFLIAQNEFPRAWSRRTMKYLHQANTFESCSIVTYFLTIKIEVIYTGWWVNEMFIEGLLAPCGRLTADWEHGICRQFQPKNNKTQSRRVSKRGKWKIVYELLASQNLLKICFDNKNLKIKLFWSTVSLRT